jgi:hypothetical protein
MRLAAASSVSIDHSTPSLLAGRQPARDVQDFLAMMPEDILSKASKILDKQKGRYPLIPAL